MNCDRVFDVLTRGPFPTGDPSDDAVEIHLISCVECRRLAEALRPALELFEEAVTPEEGPRSARLLGPAFRRAWGLGRFVREQAGRHRAVERPQPEVGPGARLVEHQRMAIFRRGRLWAGLRIALPFVRASRVLQDGERFNQRGERFGASSRDP